MGKTKHTGPVRLPKRPDPSLWAGVMPFGLGKTKPRHLRDTAKAAWHNRDRLAYAYRILSKGVCDGCALGVAGLQDQTLKGPHLCTTRLNVLRLNTMPEMGGEWVHADIEQLQKLSSAELRELGRIPYPLQRKAGERKFTRISWDEAMNRIAEAIRTFGPKRTAMYLTARGITNESYYTAAKAARLIGTNHIDNASRICHAPSKTALKRSVGIAASSCSYKDWIGTDVLVFWGSVAANNQPVSTKYMYAAKRKGTKIIVINPYKEPAMDNYWVPSIPESALFGTKLADDFYQVNIGGDIALMNGIMKRWFEMEQAETGSAIDWSFVEEHVEGVESLREHLAQQDWALLEQSSGVSRARIHELAQLLAHARSAVFIWSMGLTQHHFGTDNISQVANLALLRGFLGREHCGLMPIRGHSGVQGAGEMGADPYALPGGDSTADNRDRLAQLWGFELPEWQGLPIGTSLEHALLPDEDEHKLQVLYTSGGNFLETMPNPAFARTCLEQVSLRVHQDIVFNQSTLVEAREDVIVLPAMTRYEQPGGGTSTSTERMVYFSPEIPGPRVQEARAEWEIYVDLASRVVPEKAHLIQFANAQEIRDEIARSVPYYDGIQHLKKAGDVFQWGGAWLCEDGVCPTPTGKGQLIPVALPELRKPEGEFYVTTRRGKQFNSMIYGEKDPFNDADRYDILMHKRDARQLGVEDGTSVVLDNANGSFQGKVKLADVKPGNLQVHWPEGNCLMPNGVFERFAAIPEYNTSVKLRLCEESEANA